MAKNKFNIDEYNARLARIPPAIQEACRQALVQYSQKALNAVIKAVPRDHSDLASTIALTTGRTSLSFELSVGNEQFPYAAAVEFGHMDHDTHVPAQPFFFPSVRGPKKNFRKGLPASVKKFIKAECKGP